MTKTISIQEVSVGKIRVLFRLLVEEGLCLFLAARHKGLEVVFSRISARIKDLFQTLRDYLKQILATILAGGIVGN